MAFKKANEATAMAIKASVTALIFFRAAIVWMCRIIQFIPPSPNKHRLLEGDNRILTSRTFLADATLGALSFPSRAMVSAIAPRQVLWQ